MTEVKKKSLFLASLSLNECSKHSVRFRYGIAALQIIYLTTFLVHVEVTFFVTFKKMYAFI